ncbi:mitochondrial tRNA-specific 2-thiouridylase 1 [Drosophila bipectinata]|uniref:mitochondrial tRNA-specific 2-thiouridylase 1 n=1 Tax=Drosophila bipectinata TaxID=42026 RepID=UPI001C899066|nr:mitochondrial tRNA-specific 2-thiouridylase 1 [Drosophila bipectinata]
MIRKVVVGVSGGVDSAVTAHLLKERGYSVLGVFMRNWDEFDEAGRCSGEADLKDAEWACRRLGVELRQVNYVREYWTAVFSQFLEDYQQGLTPNPDILCNRHIKFDLFHRHCLESLNYDAVATGHYARNSLGNFLEKARGGEEDARLLIPADTFKDQTFFLAGIARKSLQRTMFPLGDLQKAQVKQLAAKIGLQRLASKRESTGICFVGKRNFKDFIREYISSKKGHFVDVDSGAIVGQHEGIHQWTVGQRCRLSSFLQPYFVARKEATSNTIYVAAGHDHPSVLSTRMHLDPPNWLCAESQRRCLSEGFLRCRFRFQHTKPLVDCSLRISDENQFQVVLDAPLRAITPGQYAVFYDDTACLGSARILRADPLQIVEGKLKEVGSSYS